MRAGRVNRAQQARLARPQITPMSQKRLRMLDSIGKRIPTKMVAIFATAFEADIFLRLILFQRLTTI
jgi:hypothetical protein